MTELLPGLYSVSVPEEASNFEKIGKELWYYVDGSGSHFKIYIEFEFEIIGTVTADTIDFKTFNHVGICDIENISLFYKDYTNPTNKFDNPDDSFRSLLTSKGLHFVNPFKHPKLSDFTVDGEYTDALEKWQQAEQNLVKKLVIIKIESHV